LNLEFIGALLFLVNVILSVSIALLIINKLYISKKISKEKDFHFYNDLFSWEIFFFIIAIENLMKIFSVFLPVDIVTYDFLLRIRILLLFFPFWNKIIHLEKIMNKITLFIIPYPFKKYCNIKTEISESDFRCNSYWIGKRFKTRNLFNKSDEYYFTYNINYRYNAYFR